jgi:hypothetical protein
MSKISPKSMSGFKKIKNSNDDDVPFALTQQEQENITVNYMCRYDKLCLEFEEKTKLTDLDMSIMFVAACLQTLRWAIISNKTHRLTSSEGDKIVPASVEQIVGDPRVPYDALVRSDKFKRKYPGFSTGLSGANHRYKTLGHDPLAGFIFGTANIATNTLSTNDFYKMCPSYYILNQQIDDIVFNVFDIATCTCNLVKEDPLTLGLSFVKQIIHIESDVFTKMGLPLPIINLVSPEASKILMNFGIDVFSVSRSFAFSMFINIIISMFHRLWFDKTSDDERFYQPRTMKILTYSQTLSSVINVSYVGFTGDAEKLDVGGILATLWTLVRNEEAIRKIKYDFVTKTLNNELKSKEDQINQELAKHGFPVY